MPEVDDDEIASQPAAFQAMRIHNSEVDHDSIYYLLDPTREQQYRQRAHYYANMTMIDEKIGQVLDALEDKGYLDDAVVIFTSDHGDALGDHGHSQKWTMYDIITRVPTVVWSPGRFTGGRVIDGLCQMMDLGPTILDIAQVPVPDNFEAISLVQALEDDAEWRGREVVFAEHGRDGILQETEFMTMVRTKKWKLVHFVDDEFGQLFDLVNDPDEKENLWDNPQYAHKRQEMINLLVEWRIRSAYHTRTWSAAWR
jgi:arylsulfatase A-like enzyme